MNIRAILFLSILLAVCSCTVEKRLYTKGLHVEFRKRLHETDSHAKQTENEMPENRPVKILSDSIADTPVIQEKQEAIVSTDTAKKIIPAIKFLSGKPKMKLAVNRIRTGISIQTHFSESLISKSLQKNRIKHSAKKSRDFDWGEFGEWMVILACTIGFIFLIASMPGVSFIEALGGVLLVILLIFLLALLISCALGDFEYWFWSGR